MYTKFTKKKVFGQLTLAIINNNDLEVEKGASYKRQYYNQKPWVVVARRQYAIGDLIDTDSFKIYTASITVIV